MSKSQAQRSVSRNPRKRRRSPGWVPDQHGAWFMVTVPAITGVILAPSWTAVPLLLTWWLGYFTFFMRQRLDPLALPRTQPASSPGLRVARRRRGCDNADL